MLIRTRQLKVEPLQRHPNVSRNAEACWICGKPASVAFTATLRVAGYKVPQGTIAYAHAVCMRSTQKRAVRRSQRES